jgi:hypothetical protein
MKRRALRKRYGRSASDDAGGNTKSTRYSGNFKILMHYRDDQQFWRDGTPKHRNGYYNVRIKELGRDGSDKGIVWRGVVGTPAILSEGVDSIKAYDATARAALAFADDEGALSGDDAMFKRDGSGYFVTGRKSHRFGFLGRKSA